MERRKFLATTGGAFMFVTLPMSLPTTRTAVFDAADVVWDSGKGKVVGGIISAPDGAFLVKWGADSDWEVMK